MYSPPQIYFVIKITVFTNIKIKSMQPTIKSDLPFRSLALLISEAPLYAQTILINGAGEIPFHIEICTIIKKTMLMVIIPLRIDFYGYSLIKHPSSLGLGEVVFIPRPKSNYHLGL